jgi:hypothetical protein
MAEQPEAQGQKTPSKLALSDKQRALVDSAMKMNVATTRTIC